MENECSANCPKMMMTLYSCDDSFDRLRADCSFSCVYPLHICVFTFTDDSDTDGEVGGNQRECSGSLPTLPTFLDSFSIFAQMNFATGCSNRDDVRARLVEAYMNVEDFVHYSMLRTNMSSNVPLSAISARTVSKASKETFLRPSFASSKPAWDAYENAYSGALISDLSNSNAYMCLAPSCAILRILARIYR